jgi:hypothetical protein
MRIKEELLNIKGHTFIIKKYRWHGYTYEIYRFNEVTEICDYVYSQGYIKTKEGMEKRLGRYLEKLTELY